MGIILDIGRPVPTHSWRVRVGVQLSPALSLNISTLQGCAMSALLHPLYTLDCISTHPDKVIKFVDATTMLGLIFGGDSTN